MESLRLHNIRSIHDSGKIDIAPLTLLVGQNSSGKSTFARFFPLLRQTSEALAREPLLWFGRLVDFGSAGEVCSKQNQGEPFGFDIELSIDQSLIAFARRSIVRRRELTRSKATISIAIRYIEQSPSKQLYQFSLRFFEHEIHLDIDQSEVVKMKINGSDCSDEIQGLFVVTGWSGCFPSLSYKADEGLANNEGAFRKRINDFVRSNTHGKTQKLRLQLLIQSITSAPLDNLLSSFKSAPAGDSIWKRTTGTWGSDSPAFLRLSRWIVGNRILDIMQVVNSAFVRQCMQLRYITPVRASAQRYYRQQGLALREIDSQGENIAMIIHNMTTSEKRLFSLWMQKYFDVHINTTAPEGHVSMMISASTEASTGFSFNLADTGFGFSQMLPILTQLWMSTRQKSSIKKNPNVSPVRIIAIEQPELHLHPKLQSRLADLLVEAIRVSREAGIDTRLVIETHSEHIINRIGLRVGLGDVQKEEISLVIFDKVGLASPSRVKSTTFDDEGLINDWPYGFFDSGD
jgi:predicted ATPase